MSVAGQRSSSSAGARLIIEPLAPSAEPRRWLIEPGGSARVGRTTLSDFVIAEDEQLSGAHFIIEWDGATGTLRDLESATGTLLGGAGVTVAALPHGAWIRAGITDFRVYREGHSRDRDRAAGAALEPAPGVTAAGLEAIHGYLQSAPGHLYAVLDAAREPRILELLKESADDHQSLFDGLAGDGLWRVAPYLVRLTPGSSPLLSRLLELGWGRSWGVYLLGEAAFRDVRRHLRRHLRVEAPDGKPMYFRLYDPRVLRRFLVMASARQVQELFGEVVHRFVAEARVAQQIHVFGQSAPAVLRHELLTVEPGAAAAEQGP